MSELPDDEIVIRAASTRPFQVPGESWRTSFAPEALESLIKQVREGFVTMNVEHLSYLPPVGRWYDGVVTPGSEGELDLFLKGRRLAERVEGRDDPLQGEAATVISASSVAGGADLTLEVALRNFNVDIQAEIGSTSPFAVRDQVQWAHVPPLIWIVSVPVAWGFVKFIGSFFEELGRETASEFARWVKTKWDKAEEPSRDRALGIEFGVTERSAITAFVPVAHDDPKSAERITSALDNLGVVATAAGHQREEAVLPDMKRAAYIFDGTQWRFAWWTEGTTVFKTPWFSENAPDAQRFLGHPPTTGPWEERADPTE